MNAVDALKMAKYWHRKWQEALEAKDFDRALEYHRQAIECRQKADVAGMMGPDFDAKKD